MQKWCHVTVKTSQPPTQNYYKYTINQVSCNFIQQSLEKPSRMEAPPPLLVTCPSLPSEAFSNAHLNLPYLLSVTIATCNVLQHQQEDLIIPVMHFKAITRVLLASFTQLEKSSSHNTSHVGYAHCSEHAAPTAPFQFLNILTTPGSPNQNVPSVALPSQAQRNKSSSPSVGHAPYFDCTHQ